MARGMVLLVLGSVLMAAPVPEEKRDPIVEKALVYLATQQQPDGSFRYQVSPHDAAATGLAMLAFLSAGVPADDPKYGDLLKKSAIYLMSRQEKTGQFKDRAGSPMMYSHGIATWALAEYTVAQGEKAPAALRAALEKGVQLIVVCQSNRGGWRYSPTPNLDGDMSITGWQAQALRAAKKAGCKVPRATFEKIEKFVDACRRQNLGFAYTPGGPPSPACTAWGTLQLLHSGVKPEQEDVQALRDVVLREVPRNRTYVLYTLHAQAQALVHFEKTSTEKGYAQIAELLKRMVKPETGEIAGKYGEERYGSVYTTSLAVLALTARNAKLATHSVR